LPLVPVVVEEEEGWEGGRDGGREGPRVKGERMVLRIMPVRPWSSSGGEEGMKEGRREEGVKGGREG